jgi:hypothetical protein
MLITVEVPVEELRAITGLDDDLAYATPYGKAGSLERLGRPYGPPPKTVVEYEWSVESDLVIERLFFEIPRLDYSEDVEILPAYTALRPGDTYQIKVTVFQKVKP